MFRVPQIDRLINCDSAVDLVFEAVAEHWQGRVKPKLMIKDVLVRDTAASNIDDPACELRRGVQPADSGLRWSRVSVRRSPSFPIPSSRARLSIALSDRTSRTAHRLRHSMPWLTTRASWPLWERAAASLSSSMYMLRARLSFADVRASLSIRCARLLPTRLSSLVDDGSAWHWRWRADRRDRGGRTR